MIPKEEFRERLTTLQGLVAESSLDVFVVTAEESIYYLTGVSYKPLERPFFIIVRPRMSPVLLVPALEEDHLRSAPNVDRIEHYWDYPSPTGTGWPERLLELLDNPARLGVETSLPQELALKLTALSPQTLPLVETLRVMKSTAEIEMLREASRYADLTVEKIIGSSYYGVSELELFSQGRSVQIQIIKDQIIRDTNYDALATSVLAASWPAPLSAQPHGVPTISDRLRDGPHIALGFLRVNGYAAECERTYFLTSPTPEVRDAFETMLKARQRAFSLVRPGVSCSEIDADTRAFLGERGYGDRVLHRTGHGFGLGNHEAPWVAEGSTDVLQENMVISIEPGIYLKNIGGIRHSDTTLVTRDGYENLTHYATDLHSLTISGTRLLTKIRGMLMRRAVGMN